MKMRVILQNDDMVNGVIYMRQDEFSNDATDSDVEHDIPDIQEGEEYVWLNLGDGKARFVRPNEILSVSMYQE